MKRLFLILLFIVGLSSDVIGQSYIVANVSSYDDSAHPQKTNNIYDCSLYGPIAPFIGFWHSYTYADYVENNLDIHIELYNNTLKNLQLPAGLKNKIDLIRIISTRECAPQTYEVLLMRIRAMIEQIEQEAKYNKRIVTKLKGTFYEPEYKAAVFYASPSKHIANMRDQMIIIRYGNKPGEPAFVVEILGKFGEDQLQFDWTHQNQ